MNHLVIIWSNASEYQEKVLAKIQSSAINVKLYAITWSSQYLESNFSRFFEKKLALNEIEKNYGLGEFLVCLVSSENNHEPIPIISEISNISRAIYLTSDEKQINRDLTLLLGRNLSDLQQESSYQSKDITIVSKDLEGVNGFADLTHLFYVLNNTIDYCVLRNFENLPDRFDPSIHGDIDLLVENLNRVISITNARKMFPDKPTSVAYYVPICKGEIRFDFRYVGDGYLDTAWEKDVLRSSKITPPYAPSRNFMTMSPMHQYFTLLYHAYVQKYKIAIDYPDKLQNFALLIGATYKDDIRYSMNQLWTFMQENGYHISIPSEKEGTLNWENLKYVSEYRSLRLKYLLTRGVVQFIEKVKRKFLKIIARII